MSSYLSKAGISAIAKDEAPYILEWIAHHQMMGVDAFYIANNDSSDGTREILSDLQQNGVVKFVDWPTRESTKPQIPAYKHLLERYGQEVEWMAFIDLDEYLWPTSATVKNLKDLLDQVKEDVGAIAINWALFGSKESTNLLSTATPNRFQWRSEKNRRINKNFKSVARTKAINDFTCPHNVILKKNWSYIHTNGSMKLTDLKHERPKQYEHSWSEACHWDSIRVNHYAVRTWPEFIDKKAKRGRAFTPSEMNLALDNDYFMAHEYCDELDPVDAHYAAELNSRISELETCLTHRSLHLSRQVPARSSAGLPQPSAGDINQIQFDEGKILITGWAISQQHQPIIGFRILLNQAHQIEIRHWKRIARKDVLEIFPTTDINCGFLIEHVFPKISAIQELLITPITLGDRPACTIRFKTPPVQP